MPKISVITICFNNLPELMDTCRSADSQSFKPFEHLVIDGSSKPGIREWLEQNPQPGYRSWLCEKDAGIADAFNKGISMAKGDVVVMMNSGDVFFDEHTLETVNRAFEQNPSISWLHGKYQLQRGGLEVIIGKPFEKGKLYRGMRSICHQTMYYKKELHDRYGLYDVQEKIGMDYDFLCRIANEPFIFLPDTLARFAPEGASSVHYLKALKDARRIYEKYYGKSFLLRVWQFRLKTLHFLLHSPIGHWLYRIKTGLKLENM